MIKQEYQCRDCIKLGEIPHRFREKSSWLCREDSWNHIWHSIVLDVTDCEVG